MITSPQELETTNQMIQRFIEARSRLESLKEGNRNDVEYEILAIDSIISDLKKELQWYQDVINNIEKVDELNSIDQLPSFVAGRRLQLGISKDEFAKRLGIAPDIYQELEFNDFYGISSDLFHRMLNILEIKNVGNLFIEAPNASITKIESNLKALGISSNLVSNTINMPIKNLKQLIKTNINEGAYLLEKLISGFKAFFSIDLRENLTQAKLTDAFAVAFKHRVNIDPNNLTLVTAFTANIAWVVAKHFKDLTKKEKADPIEIRRKILSKYASISLESCLDFIWELGIPVIPFDIQRGFHGACINFNGTIVIALNQQTKSTARWKFDLLHELYHALTMDYNIYIEHKDIMSRNDDDEKNASDFASYVVFGSEMETYLQMVIENSYGNIQFIKNNIVRIASRYNLSIDDFSNYVAYRLSKSGANLWGAITNIQEATEDPLDVTRMVLFKRLAQWPISENDIHLLQKALQERMIL